MPIIFPGPFGIIGFILSYFEKRILLGGVASVTRFVTGHEQTQSNRDCYFLFFGAFLDCNGSNFLEVIWPEPRRDKLSDQNVQFQ